MKTLELRNAGGSVATYVGDAKKGPVIFTVKGDPVAALVGAITDRARQVHPAARLVSLGGVSVVGLLAAAGFYSLSPDSWPFYACWLASQAYLLGWYGSLVAAVEKVTGPLV